MENEKSKRKVGRKKSENSAVHRLNFRLTPDEYSKYKSLFSESGMKNQSKFITAMLFGRTMKVVKIDKAAFDYFVRLTQFYSQYQAVGNNYNQVVKAVRTNFSEKRGLSLIYQLEKYTLELVKISTQIIRLTKEFEEKHLKH